jgi:hypothetical protein
VGVACVIPLAPQRGILKHQIEKSGETLIIKGAKQIEPTEVLKNNKTRKNVNE